jgi:hypothetical protein
MCAGVNTGRITARPGEDGSFQVFNEFRGLYVILTVCSHRLPWHTHQSGLRADTGGRWTPVSDGQSHDHEQFPVLCHGQPFMIMALRRRGARLSIAAVVRQACEDGLADGGATRRSASDRRGVRRGGGGCFLKELT